MADAGREQPDGPDFSQGVAPEAVSESRALLGHVAGEEAVMARQGDDFFVIGAHCTHYHGPLAEGLVVGGSIRCPWHHACFSLRSGRALRAPAFDPLPRWRVERADGKISPAKDFPIPGRPRTGAPRNHAASSSSAVARRASPPRRCCGPRAMTESWR